MIEQLKAYLSENNCDYERDTKQQILLDEDRIQIYFFVDEDFDATVTEVNLFNEDGSEKASFATANAIPLITTLLNEWVKPSDNTIVIEGRIYN